VLAKLHALTTVAACVCNFLGTFLMQHKIGPFVLHRTWYPKKLWEDAAAVTSACNFANIDAVHFANVNPA